MRMRRWRHYAEFLSSQKQAKTITRSFWHNLFFYYFFSLLFVISSCTVQLLIWLPRWNPHCFLQRWWAWPRRCPGVSSRSRGWQHYSLLPVLPLLTANYLLPTPGQSWNKVNKVIMNSRSRGWQRYSLLPALPLLTASCLLPALGQS